MLEREEKMFEQQLGSWLISHANQYVLLCGDTEPVFFDSFYDAYESGLTRFGQTPFLVKPVSEASAFDKITVPALQLNIIHAFVKS